MAVAVNPNPSEESKESWDYSVDLLQEALRELRFGSTYGELIRLVRRAAPSQAARLYYLKLKAHMMLLVPYYFYTSQRTILIKTLQGLQPQYADTPEADYITKLIHRLKRHE